MGSTRKLNSLLSNREGLHRFTSLKRKHIMKHFMFCVESPESKSFKKTFTHLIYSNKSKKSNSLPWIAPIH